MQVKILLTWCLMASYNNCLPEGLSKSPTIQKVTGLTKESSAEKKGGVQGEYLKVNEGKLQVFFIWRKNKVHMQRFQKKRKKIYEKSGEG